MPQAWGKDSAMTEEFVMGQSANFIAVKTYNSSSASGIVLGHARR